MNLVRQKMRMNLRASRAWGLGMKMNLKDMLMLQMTVGAHE